MKILFIKDASGTLFGYERGHENRSFSPNNSIYLSFAEHEREWAEKFADSLNKPQLNLALPITILEIELP